jgi:hypothetical protein
LSHSGIGDILLPVITRIRETILRSVLAGGIVAVLATNTLAEPAGSEGQAPAPVSDAKSAWQRVVLIGASATAGFTESEPLGGPYTPMFELDRYLNAALLVKHEPIRNVASTFFFLQPELEGRRQIEQALQANATLVVGIDFLFWFCYGKANSNEDRLDRLEVALKLLESLKIPLVIGDIPDASAAGNRILTPDQIPNAKLIHTANIRLKRWVESRRNTVIVPLAQFMSAAAANQPLVVHGQSFPEGKTRIFLQDDKLHPSPPGCALLAVTVLDIFQPGLTAQEARWNPREIYRLVFDATRPRPVAPRP